MPKLNIHKLTDDELLEFEKNNHDQVERFKQEVQSGESDIETEAEYIATLLTHKKIVKEWNRRGVGLSPGVKKIFRKKIL